MLCVRGTWTRTWRTHRDSCNELAALPLIGEASTGVDHRTGRQPHSLSIVRR
jgi:hypothetical protein